jgi:hypothetical protein
MPTSLSIPCPQVIRGCDCTNDPISNYSSESPDHEVFFGHYNQPPTDGTWFAPGCLGTCESVVSQQSADECAARQAAECSFDNTPDGGNPVPGGHGGFQTPRFGNTLQSCDAECEGGAGTVTALVAPGTVISATQADANARAHALACKEAERVRVCFSTMSPLPPACVTGGDGSQYTVPILVFGGTPPYTFALVSGALPNGLEFFDVGLISGIAADAAGTYTFEIMVTDAVGTSVIKEFTMRVVIISTVFLDQLYPGVPYSDTLNSLGATAPLTWSIIAGTLPVGLSLNPTTGVISGTPAATTQNEFPITVQLVDSGSPPCSCSTPLVISRFCADSAINSKDVTWNKFGGGTGSIVAGNGTFDNNAGDADGPSFAGQLCTDASYMLTVTIPFSASGPIPSVPFDIRFTLKFNGATVAQQDFGGSFAAPWVLNDTAVLTAALPAQDLTTIQILTGIKGNITSEVSGTIAISPLTRP